MKQLLCEEWSRAGREMLFEQDIPVHCLGKLQEGTGCPQPGPIPTRSVLGAKSVDCTSAALELFLVS